MNWYEDDKLWQVFYEYMFDSVSFERAQQQCSEILSFVNHPVDDVLDLACGPGRHCLPLAKMGFQVTGVDISEYLLKKAKKYAQSADLDIHFLQADMSQYVSPHQFDLIINMFNSFGYLDSQEKNQKVLELAFQSLKSQGTLIIDTVGKEPLARAIQPTHLTEYEDGALRIERPYLSDDLQVFNNEWILIKDEQLFRREYQHHLYSALELKLMCRQAGFDEVSVYGSLQADEYELDSEQLVVVAEKK